MKKILIFIKLEKGSTDNVQGKCGNPGGLV